MKYNYEEFTSGEYNFSEQKGIQVGEVFPNFEVTSQNGEIISLFDNTGKITVLETGSITCPLYSGNIVGMNEIAKEHTDVDFTILYVREAHPGNKIPNHTDIERKVSLANNIKNHYPENRKILIDDIDGTIHEKIGLLPNTLLIIGKNREVLYKIDWNNRETLSKALERIEKNKSTEDIIQKFRPAPPTISIPVLYRAGTNALFDFLRQIPKVIFQRTKNFFTSDTKQF